MVGLSAEMRECAFEKDTSGFLQDQGAGV